MNKISGSIFVEWKKMYFQWNVEFDIYLLVQLYKLHCTVFLIFIFYLFFDLSQKKSGMLEVSHCVISVDFSLVILF